MYYDNQIDLEELKKGTVTHIAFIGAVYFEHTPILHKGAEKAFFKSSILAGAAALNSKPEKSHKHFKESFAFNMIKYGTVGILKAYLGAGALLAECIGGATKVVLKDWYADSLSFNTPIQAGIGCGNGVAYGTLEPYGKATTVAMFPLIETTTEWLKDILHIPTEDTSIAATFDTP